MTLGVLLLTSLVFILFFGALISAAAALTEYQDRVQMFGLGLLITAGFCILHSGILSACWAIGELFV